MYPAYHCVCRRAIAAIGATLTFVIVIVQHSLNQFCLVPLLSPRTLAHADISSEFPQAYGVCRFPFGAALPEGNPCTDLCLHDKRQPRSA